MQRVRTRRGDHHAVTVNDFKPTRIRDAEELLQILIGIGNDIFLAQGLAGHEQGICRYQFSPNIRLRKHRRTIGTPTSQGFGPRNRTASLEVNSVDRRDGDDRCRGRTGWNRPKDQTGSGRTSALEWVAERENVHRFPCVRS